MLTLTCLAMLAIPAFAADEKPIYGLMSAAGAAEMPHVAAIEGRPVSQEVKFTDGTLLCKMDLQYKERAFGLVIVRLFKEINGTAVVTCPNNAPVTLSIHGAGPSIGLGIPNNGPFHSTASGFAGSLQVRIPFPFVPKQLEGEYLNAGVEVVGAGVSFSPWVNTDASFNTTIYLPSSLNASLAINLNSITLKLRR